MMVAYHGSGRIRGERFISKGEMTISKGDDHWLGNGVYFFVDFKHAYKWICYMYRSRNGKLPINNHVTKSYLVLQANINVDEQRILDLDDEDIILELQYIKENVINILVKNKKFRKKDIKNIKDGVILNVMFNEMDYLELYDMVSYTFPTDMNSGRCSKISVKEKQLCVKNPSIISNIEEVPEYFCEKNNKYVISFTDYKDGIKSEGGNSPKKKKRSKKGDSKHGNIKRKNDVYKQFFQ